MTRRIPSQLRGLFDGSVLLVAGAYILTPKGVRVEGNGLEPDVLVAAPDLPFYSPAQVARDNDPQYAAAVRVATGQPRSVSLVPDGHHRI